MRKYCSPTRNDSTMTSVCYKQTDCTEYSSSYSTGTISQKTTRHFHQLPSLCQQRNVQVNARSTPHRKACADRLANLCSHSTFMPLVEQKPIVRSARPQDFIKSLQDFGEAMKNKSASRANHAAAPSSNSPKKKKSVRFEDQDVHLPALRCPSQNTFEAYGPDCVSFRAQYRHKLPGVWQQVGPDWDRMQKRPDQFCVSLPAIEVKEECCQGCRSTGTCATGGPEDSAAEVKGHLQGSCEKPQADKFIRQLPGYGGFVPKHLPIGMKLLEEPSSTETMISTFRRTHRKFPMQEYKRLEHARKAPFAKTVTLTYPFNPFNMVI